MSAPRASLVPERPDHSVSATDPEPLAVPPPAESTVRRQMAAASRRIKRLKRIDRAAVAIITLGGIAVVAERHRDPGLHRRRRRVPLFRGASAALAGTLAASAAAAAGDHGAPGARQR